MVPWNVDSFHLPRTLVGAESSPRAPPRRTAPLEHRVCVDYRLHRLWTGNLGCVSWWYLRCWCYSRHLTSSPPRKALAVSVPGSLLVCGTRADPFPERPVCPVRDYWPLYLCGAYPSVRRRFASLGWRQDRYTSGAGSDPGHDSGRSPVFPVPESGPGTKSPTAPTDRVVLRYDPTLRVPLDTPWLGDGGCGTSRRLTSPTTPDGYEDTTQDPSVGDDRNPKGSGIP